MTKTMKKRVALAIATISWVTFIFWAGGFNFDRGPLLAYLIVCATILSVLVASFPGIDD